MGRSRKLTLTNWTLANNALMQYFEGNKSNLAAHLSMSRTTVTDFFNEKFIGERSFRKICLALRLNTKDVSSTDLPIASHGGQNLSQTQFNEDRFEQIRERCRQKILGQHSQMRLLDGEEISVEQLYVDVWLLEKPEHKHFNTPESLLNNFDIKEDRLALSKRIRRGPGFEAASTHSKLVILGKPGSGKTTFLKHLALDWCKGNFKSDQIALLIELRSIQDRRWNIWSTLSKELGMDDRSDFIEIKKNINSTETDLAVKKEAFEAFEKISIEDTPEEDKRDASFKILKTKNEIEKLEERIKALKAKLEVLPTHRLLKQGKLLILMDGLDEIFASDLRVFIQDSIASLLNDYPRNNFVLTCRTQVMERLISGFKPVEVAYFRPEQVKDFVRNWFIAKGYSDNEVDNLWKTVKHTIAEKPALRELTKTPVLLSLICLVLQDEHGELPTDEGWLYRKGIKLLLSRWNEEKGNNENWKLGTEQYRRLSLEDKEALLTEIAAQKFENPKNFILFEQDELARKIIQKFKFSNIRDGVSVLRAMEAQHGLLIERADELWSFSHLTFQEYFTVQWLSQLPSQDLAEKISSQHWKQVIEQLVKSQQPADFFLRLIKRAIDQSIAQEPDLQLFLTWLLCKSKSVKASYRLVAIRALYFSFSFGRNYDLALTLEHARPLDPNRALDSALDFTLSDEIALDFALNQVLNRIFTSNNDLSDVLNRASDIAPELATHLCHLKDSLPIENSQKWHSSHGDQWTIKLRQLMIQYRDIGHNWQFRKEQQQQLQRFYEASKFLVDLMHIQGAVSEDCRTEIENSLLLPWRELQRS